MAVAIIIIAYVSEYIHVAFSWIWGLP